MSQADVYVHVLYDFSYLNDDGSEIKLKKDEELLLIQKSNADWWQVIRSCEDEPFFAPASYLSIVGKNCYKALQEYDLNDNFENNNDTAETDENKNNDKSIFIDFSKNILISESLEGFKQDHKASKSVKSTGPFSFKNPLCLDESFKHTNTNENHVDEKPQKSDDSAAAKTTNCKNSKLKDSELSSPIYANLSQMQCRYPPIPTLADTPIRALPNDWFEYEEKSGRKYYFHMTSGKVTWKPPRRRDSYQCSPAPTPPPKQLKPKLHKFTSPTSPFTLTIIPQGWTQECDLKSGAVYFINESTKKKWFSSVDENGRTYFYDEDSSESVWELPDASPTDNQGVEKCDVNETSSLECSFQTSPTDSKGSPKMRKKAPKLPVPRHLKSRSMVIPECVNLTSPDDNKGFLPASFAEGYWPSVQNGQFTTTRKGTLNTTKVVYAGKRIKKSWTSSFVVLTDVLLVFYKDVRSAHLAIPGVKPEVCIDLNGAIIDWCPEMSSRKNVFQISTFIGQKLLLQDDNAQTTKEWFDAIEAAIMMLPSSLEQSDSRHLTTDVKLSRSKSTKQYSSKSNNEEGNLSIPAEKKRKIRDKLRQFFVRRPTMESLREKGIILDEPVFGCQLENLCLREGNPIPKFVLKCIETIERKELTADGLYRASGNLSQVQKIRIHVNQDDYSCLNEEEDVHVITGALKMFFREMKEPLFPFYMFDGFLNAIVLPDAISKLEALRELVHKLPEPNYETLKYLLQHLLRVTEYHRQNRMQVQNVAIVFGPTLMWPEHASSNLALDMMHQNRIVEFLLLEFRNIFSKV